jgi:hypothetical protein
MRTERSMSLTLVWPLKSSSTWSEVSFCDVQFLALKRIQLPRSEIRESALQSELF